MTTHDDCNWYDVFWQILPFIKLRKNKKHGKLIFLNHVLICDYQKDTAFYLFFIFYLFIIIIYVLFLLNTYPINEL